MAKKMGVETVTVVRGGKVDKFSRDTPATAEHYITGCSVLPRSMLDENKGWTIVDGKQVIAPFGSDVLPGDQIRYGGVLWNVDGVPGSYRNRAGLGKAVIFYLERVGRPA